MADDQGSKVSLQEHNYGDGVVEQGTNETGAGSSDSRGGTQICGKAEKNSATTADAEVGVEEPVRAEKGTGDGVKSTSSKSVEGKNENKSKAATMDTSATDAREDEKKYPFVCGICQKKFDELSEFCTHFKSHDNVEKYFHSSKKDKKVEMFQALEMMEKVDSNLYECGVCNTKFPSIRHLHEHMLTVENMTDYRYNNEKRLAYSDVKKKGEEEIVEEEEEDEIDQGTRPRRKRKESLKAKLAAESIEEEKAERKSGRDGQRKEKETGADKSVSSKTPQQKTNEADQEEKETVPVVTPRGRGRPRKYPPKEVVTKSKDEETPVKRGRGRPRKSDVAKSEESKENSSNIEKSKKSSENETPGKSPRAKSVKKDSATESEDQMFIDSPRKSTLYGLRGKRKMNKRYSDYVTDKRLSTFSKSESDFSSEDEVKPETKKQKVKKDTDGEISQKKLVKKPQEKNDKSNKIGVKKEASEDISKDADDNTTTALDGTEHVTDDKDESEIPDDRDADEEDDTVDDPSYDPTMEESKESPVKVLKPKPAFIGSRLVPCSICGKKYDRRRIKKHMIAHKSIRDSECDICGKTFKCKAHMNDHKRIVHIKPRLSCKICYRVFKHMKTLEQHLLLHVRRSDIAILEEDNEHYIEVLDEEPEKEKAPVEIKKEALKTEENGDNNLTELAEQLVNLNNDILNENERKAAASETSEKETNTEEPQGDTLYCKKCEEEFDSIEALREHLTKHNIYRCEKCSKVFRSLSHLKRHYIAHKVERKFKCEKCFSSFKSAAHVRDHDRIVHMRVDPYVCNICGDSYKTERHLWSHKNMHLMKSNKYYSKEVVELLQKEEMQRCQEREKYLNPKTTICDTCGKEICTKRYKRHQDTHKKEKDIPCDMCPKKFSSIRYMKDHRNRSHLSKKQTTCDICGINFKANYIDKHRLIHGPRDKACPHCGKMFTTDFYLKVHLNSHAAYNKNSDSILDNETELFICNVCDNTFETEKQLLYHKKTHMMENDPYFNEEILAMLLAEERVRNGLGEDLNPKTTICVTCGKEVCTRRYKRHLDTHRKIKDVPCDICPKKFTSVRYMRDHKNRYHLDTKQVICEICGVSLKARYIDNHRKIHGPRDKPCPHCGKLFTTEFYLKFHLATHAEKNQFECTFCDATFSRKSRLAIHLTEKHNQGEKRPCKYCHEMFSSRQKARKHERKVHEGYKAPYRDKSKYRKRAIRMVDVNTETEGLFDSEEELEDDEVIMAREAAEEAEEELLQTPCKEMNLDQAEEVEGGNIEHILEIPEDSEGCQILLYPNGTFKMINADGEEETLRVITTIQS